MSQDNLKTMIDSHKGGPTKNNQPSMTAQLKKQVKKVKAKHIIDTSLFLFGAYILFKFSDELGKAFEEMVPNEHSTLEMIQE